jgi:hypothetical protein
MKLMRLLTIAALLGFAGCVASLHEFYTEQTLVFDPALAGVWRQQDNDYRWQFVPNEEKQAYTLTITEKEDTQSKLMVHLFEIDGRRFMNLHPARDTHLETGDWTKAHLIAAHHVLKVDRDGPHLLLAALNPETIERILKEKPNIVKHERLDDRFVLTDSPKGLQAFLKAGLDIDNFFTKPGTLEPITP